MGELSSFHANLSVGADCPHTEAEESKQGGGPDAPSPKSPHRSHHLLSLHGVQPTLRGRRMKLHSLKGLGAANLWAYFKTAAHAIPQFYNNFMSYFQK